MLENDLTLSLQLILCADYTSLVAFRRSCDSTLHSAKTGVKAVTDRIHEIVHEVDSSNTEVV